MTQKTLFPTSGCMPANQPSSLIERISKGRSAQPARTDDLTHDARLCTNADSSPTATVVTKAINGVTCTPNTSPLKYLIAQVRSCYRDRLLKEREVLAIVGRSKAAMRRDVSLGLFPKPVKTGTKSSAWRESEVMGWVEATTILSRIDNPGFDMKDYVAALNTRIDAEVSA
ncbi:helix-turn-helix transcriptional regulator [Burkholderia pseudomallei]|uniref:helix-turn-helix transcriptional regulator n=1 Tax=Burkholderia pseudomallei TaxID=28450 RepID=UPI000F268EDD|nr:AlpA family phage regulatory protein [Burkholderia pseudomallei]CAJ4818437.1 phage transcriptional regulator AlpA [Burkholderia pseudomallei]CAJ9365501.1 phage transcriptional regulator AlpA [Burkholderia pseudomallei]VBB90228.1 phage transcriptional regulator AlpA [Burkholderia pseudomallei]VBD73735.1 phage transcriptional regulator AlpA [Burkholderia pseudomallei]VBE22852.1 phage transcriptional regulator AlpA [Burkholderia pseudomallei]